jgi:hypothetical protein
VCVCVYILYIYIYIYMYIYGGGEGQRTPKLAEMPASPRPHAFIYSLPYKPTTGMTF